MSDATASPASSTRMLTLYIALVTAFGATLAGFVAAATATNPGSIGWPLIAVAFAAAELGVVHVRLGRDSFSFTLHEGALVAAAVLASPREVLIGLTVGTVVVMAGVQRLPFSKVCFNLGQYLAGAAVVTTVLHPLGFEVVMTPLGWLAALSTALVVSVSTMLLIAVALRLAQGTPIVATVTAATASSLGMTVISTSVGLLVLIAAGAGLPQLLLVVPVLGVVAVGVRAHFNLRGRAEQLELVHDTIRTLALATDLESALEFLASRAKSSLRAGRAMVVLGADEGEARLLSVGADGIEWGTASPQLVEALRAATRAGNGAASIESSANLFSDVFEGVDVPSIALVAELAAAGRVHGVLAVLQERGVANAGQAELDLLASLALHAALSLEANRLASTNAVLRHRAGVDPLLGLPTAQAIDDAIERADGPVALVYVSLAEFEAVNDLFGFEVGDRLLGAVSTRLSNLVRPEDVVARVGGDEFAVLITAASDPFAIEAFAERVAQQIGIPFQLSGVDDPVMVSARVGVGFGDGGDASSTQLIRAAHEHLRRRRMRRHLGHNGW